MTDQTKTGAITGTGTITDTISPAESSPAKRLTRPALIRGWQRKCPCCGSAPLLYGYLKVHDSCPTCREELHHHRADDGPAYLTILIVGHILAPLLLFVFVRFRPEPFTLFAVFAIGCVSLSLYLLPRLKGAMIGFQWARYMHGFRQKP